MKSLCTFVVAFLASLGAAQFQPARAQACIPLFGACPPSVPTPTSGDAKSTINVTPSGDKLRALDPTKFYIVQIKCKIGPGGGITIHDGLIVKRTSAISESLWISDVNTPLDGKVPTSPTKLINFAIGTLTTSGNTSFTNNACSDKFIVSGASSRLTVVYGTQESSVPSHFGNFFFGALNLFTGVASVFANGPIAKAAVSDATTLAKTQGTLQTLITGINADPLSTSFSYNLGTPNGTLAVSSPIGEVLITTTPISDISSQISQDPVLLQSFYKTIGTAAAPYLTGITAANVQAQCAAFANQNVMNGYYSFSTKDLVFIMGYFAQMASPSDVGARLGCIGGDVTSLSYVLNFPYNKSLGPLRAITLQDIYNYVTPGGQPSVSVSSTVAQPYLDKLMNLMGRYSQNPSDMTKKNLLDFASNQFDVSDDTAAVFPGQSGKVTADVFVMSLNKAGYPRFGCYYYAPANGFDATFLALPQSPAKGASYQIGELLGIQIRIDRDTQKVSVIDITRVRLANDSAIIQTPATQNGGICGQAPPITITKS